MVVTAYVRVLHLQDMPAVPLALLYKKRRVKRSLFCIYHGQGFMGAARTLPNIQKIDWMSPPYPEPDAWQWAVLKRRVLMRWSWVTMELWDVGRFGEPWQGWAGSLQLVSTFRGILTPGKQVLHILIWRHIISSGIELWTPHILIQDQHFSMNRKNIVISLTTAYCHISQALKCVLDKTSQVNRKENLCISSFFLYYHILLLLWFLFDGKTYINFGSMSLHFMLPCTS